MKKIIFILDEVDASGVSKALINYLNLFDRTIFKVDLLLFNQNGVWEEKIPKDVKISHLFKKSPERRSKMQRVLFSFGMVLYPKMFLRKKIDLKKYDILIDYKGQYPEILGIFKRKKITWIHGDLSLENNPIEKNNFDLYGKKMSYKYKQKIRKRGFVYSDKIVCVSETMRGNFVCRYGFEEKTYFAQNVFDIKNILRTSTEEYILPQQDKMVFCCITRVSSGKGIERLLYSAKRLNDLQYKFILLIVGSGDTINEMIKLKSDMGLTNVFFLGHFEHPSSVLSKSDVFVCPSLTEAFSTTTFEAYLLNKAVLSTDVGSVKEFITNGKNGIIVENTDSGLFGGMAYLLDNPSLIEKIENELLSSEYSYNPLDNAKLIDKIILY